MDKIEKSLYLTQREHKEVFSQDDPRTNFVHDRDRIIHSKAFRRLMHKTQIFNANKGDHFRNRLTHTLEVAQIARSIGRRMNLNEDLIEAIALGHDLGHTPFGHIGERKLGELMHEGLKGVFDGSQFSFKHNFQSVRVVEYIENKCDDFPGINLTLAVREGMIKHTKLQTKDMCDGSVKLRILLWGRNGVAKADIGYIAGILGFFQKIYGMLIGENFSKIYVYAHKYERLTVLKQFNPLFSMEMLHDPKTEEKGRKLYSRHCDIDILLTVDLEQAEIAKHRNDVAKVTSRLSLEHDITVSVTVKPLEQFRRYQTALPYYRNVVREGIRYAGA